ncbi:MAG: PEP-utilizing enzyme [Sideroxyarcus sp.]|nr:PEP-utilizing enzyme [Sideroxyarcus sp.]
MEDRRRHTLNGLPASMGTAAGCPRIVRNHLDLNKIAVGDILVATETDINYVPAMLRAAAIVTETGGRFCHAAVWARENNKPTILQAENATNLLSGVSLVMVNANIGMVEWEQ